MKLTSYFLHHPENKKCVMSKQYSIWGQFQSNCISPLIYLQRPKWIKDDEVWKQVCESVKIELPENFEVK